jgi:hypothetical protein
MADMTEPLTFEGKFTEGDVRRLRRLGISRVYYWIIAFLGLSLVGDILGFSADDGALKFWLLGFRALLLVSCLVFLFFPKYACSREYRAIDVSSVVSGRVSSEGVTWAHSGRAVTLPWHGVVGWRASSDALVLLSAPANSVFITRDLLRSAEDWSMLRNQVFNRVHRSKVAQLLW